MLTWALVGLVAIPLLVGLDRLGLWMEDRGWIYYRKKKARPGSFGNALLELQAFIEPSKQYIVQEKKSIRRQDAKPGDPPKPWTHS